MLKYILHCCIIIPLFAKAQRVQVENLSPLYTGQSLVDSMVNPFAYTANPALLARHDVFIVGLQSERKFLLPDLNVVHLSLAFPTISGGLGFNITHSGHLDYRSSVVNLSYGKSLGKLDIGTGFNYIHQSATAYKTHHLVSANIGMTMVVSSSFDIGIGVQHLPVIRSMQRPGFDITMRGHYRFSETVNIDINFIKSEDRVINVLTAISYAFADRMVIRVGLETAPLSPAVLLGWRWNNIVGVISARYHLLLGVSPGIQFVFSK